MGWSEVAARSHARRLETIAAWLTGRGHGFSGARELLEDGEWAGQISWRDHRGYREATHRPDLVVHRNGGHVALEIEVAKKSVERLREILTRHLVWRSVGATGGVVYACRDLDGCNRIRTVGADVGFVGTRHGLRVELLGTIKAQAIEARNAMRAESAATVGSAPAA